MTETLHSRIENLIAQRGISVREAERLCGLSDGTIRKLLANPDQMPMGRTLQAIAAGLETTETFLLTGVEGPPPVNVRSNGPASIPPAPHRDSMPNDVPVMGTAAGNHLRGAFKLGSDPVDWVRRPPGVMNARGIYALYVEGESMIPQYWPADLIYINPFKPVRVDDPVVVQTSYIEGEVEGTLGIYRRRDEDYIVIGKHNPKAEVKIRRGNNTMVHKVLTNNELFGV